MDTKKLRQKILDLAIRGKLVPQDPNDEPASVLLERIRAEKEQLIKEGKIKRSKKSAATDKSHYENVPFEIPESWCWCQFGEYLDVRDGTHDSPKYVDKGFPFVTSKNLNNGRIDFSTAKFISEEDHINFSQRSFVEDGDILFAMIGSIGNPVLVVKDRDFSIKNVALFKPYDRKNTYMEYVLYYLHYIQESLRQDAKGGMQPFIPLNYFRKDLMIPLPPLNEQKKIVSELQKLIALIDEVDYKASGIRADVNKTKSKILDLAISGKLVPQDSNDEPAIELLRRINPGFKPCDNSHYENLPQGWTVCKIKDIFNITMGQSPTGESINGVKGIEFHQGKIHFTESYLSQSGVYTDQPTKIAEVDSLLLCVRAPVGVLNITQRKICIGRGLCALKPKYEIDNLYWLFILTAYKDYFESNATGSTFKAISGDTIKNALIKLPPLQEQKRILSSIISLYELLDAITAEL